MRREVVEDDAFRAELRALVPDAVEADALLEFGFDYLSVLGDIQPQINGTDLYYKTIPDPSRERFLVLFYHIHEHQIILRSIKTFSLQDEDFEW
jgi:hypothetical protein